MHFPDNIPQTNCGGTPRGNDVIALSLRRLWTIYKRTAIAQGTGVGKRDLALSQVAFYAGARGVLKVLDHMLAESDYEGLHKAIQQHGRLINAIQGRRPRARGN
jgi:hypothetical protein